MTNQLSDLEAQVFERIKATAKLNSIWGAGIENVVKEPTTDGVKKMIAQLLLQWNDDPGIMFDVLGFDLPKFLNMQFFSLEEMNDHLARTAQKYRVEKETRCTNRDAEWCGRAGYFHMQAHTGNVWVDSCLGRYIVLSNGQVFQCTNADLTSLPEVEKEHTRALLTGLMD